MSLFTHIVVGSNDLEKSRTFYDAVLTALGISRMDVGAIGQPTAYMYGKERPEFIVTTPINGEPACHANGGTIGFAATDNASVDLFYANATANGGVCEGAPAPRPGAANAYGCYVRDPDGNKLCAYNFG